MPQYQIASQGTASQYSIQSAWSVSSQSILRCMRRHITCLDCIITCPAVPPHWLEATQATSFHYHGHVPEARVIVGWLSDLSIRCAREIMNDQLAGSCDPQEVASCMYLECRGKNPWLIQLTGKHLYATCQGTTYHHGTIWWRGAAATWVRRTLWNWTICVSLDGKKLCMA